MPDRIIKHNALAPGDVPIKFKDLGDGSFALYMALEPASIGGGGALGAAVSIIDGGDVAQGTTTDLASANTVIGLLKNLKAALAGTLTTGALTDAQLRATPVPVSGTFFQGTQPVSGPITDTQLRASAVPVSGTFFQGTQPVSLATNTPDVTDRAARLLGHVTVDTAPSTPVTNAGTFAVQSSATLAVDSIGLAKDATLTAALGSASDTPSAYTVLDQLTKLRKAAEAIVKTQQQILALQTPALPRKTQPTLLHRS